MATSNRKVVVTLDTYLSILAVVSSFCAIGITFYQAFLQRTEQYASVMPIMDNYLNNGGNDKAWHLAYVFVNNGVGPAIIQKAEITYKGKPYQNLHEIADVIIDEKLAQHAVNPTDISNVTITKSDFWPTRVITVVQVIELCNVDHKYVARWLDEAIGRGDIRVKIWYKSIYGEQWRFDSTPERIELRNVKVDE